MSGRGLVRAVWATVVAGVVLAAPSRAAAQDFDPQQQIETIIARCVIRDGTAPATERLSCWETATILAPNDPRVLEGIKNARAGMQEEEKARLQQAETKSKSSRDSIEFLLARANQDLVNGSVDGADMYVTRVLEMDPKHIEARALRDRVSTARKWQARKNLALAIGVAVTAFAAGFALFWGKFKEWRGKSAQQNGGNASSAPPAKAGGRVALRVVDGIGRGRLYSVNGEIYRIGAAESERAEEANDLLINDSDARISRFHCSLLKRKKQWTIVDSSVNGTWVNDKRLERGESAPLRDGDEIILAGVTRMVFTRL